MVYDLLKVENSLNKSTAFGFQFTYVYILGERSKTAKMSWISNITQYTHHHHIACMSDQNQIAQATVCGVVATEHAIDGCIWAGTNKIRVISRIASFAWCSFCKCSPVAAIECLNNLINIIIIIIMCVFVFYIISRRLEKAAAAGRHRQVSSHYKSHKRK